MRFVLSRNSPITLRFLDLQLISGVLCTPVKKSRCYCNHLLSFTIHKRLRTGRREKLQQCGERGYMLDPLCAGFLFFYSFALSCFWPRPSYCYFNCTFVCRDGRCCGRILLSTGRLVLFTVFCRWPVRTGRCNRFTGERHVVSLDTLRDFYFFQRNIVLL